MTFGHVRAAAILLLLASQSFAQSAPRIAIIIDDLGYQLAAGHRTVALPGPVACAILPGTPGSAQLAHAARERGKEVLVHLPLQSVDRHSPAEPGSITIDTTRQSVALQIAAEKGVPAIKRDVFLDSDPAPEMVAREFERLKSLAREQGRAVAIGHPYPETLAFLERAIPGLVEEGIELVPLRELIDFP